MRLGQNLPVLVIFASIWAIGLSPFSPLLAADPPPVHDDFEDAEVGTLPPGWATDRTGTGSGSNWKVVEDQTAPKGPKVLAQLAESPSFVFNLCIAAESSFLDGEISVAFKAVEGDNDQGGGIVWRYVNSNNYYIARMNPLESNFRLYKVVAGRRMQLATVEDCQIAANEWHTLTVHQQGPNIVCFVDGEHKLEATDTTYKLPGKVGLWTKSDARTYFDNFTATPKE